MGAIFLQNTLLQRLPNIPQLRALHIINVSDHVLGPVTEVMDWVLQLTNVIVLRREIQLRYFGFRSKCFELSEGPVRHNNHHHHINHSAGSTTNVDPFGPDLVIINNQSDNVSTDGSFVEQAEGDDPGFTSSSSGSSVSGTDSDSDAGSHADNQSTADSFIEPGRRSTARLKIKEVGFIDSVTVFRAHSARL